MSREQDSHLSRISTVWTQVVAAHGEQLEAARLAKSHLIQCYSGATYRYLLKLLGDPDAADEVFQEFAVAFMRGGYRHADQAKGRFRDYLKTSVYRLALKYRARRAMHREQPLGDGALAIDEQRPESGELDEFLASWREELLDRAWSALRADDQRGGHSYFTILQLRARHPEANSSALARELSAATGGAEPVTAAHARKLLQRARAKFAEFLLDAVAQSLPQPDWESLENELIELDLLNYCRRALQKRREAG